MIKRIFKNSDIHFPLFLLFFLLIEITNLTKKLDSKIKINNTLDFSWSIDMIQRFYSGFIAGRDFIFTYGPLYQFIISFPGNLLNTPSFSSLILSSLTLKLILLILIFLFIENLFSEKKSKLIFFIFLSSLTLIYSDSNMSIRIISPFIFSLYYLKYVVQKKGNKIQIAIIHAVPSIMGLYIFELFLTCIVIIFLFYLFTALINKNKFKFNIQKIIKGLGSLSIILILEIILSSILSGNLDYFYDSILTVSDYKYIMNIPFSLNPYFLLLIFPFILFLIFIVKFKEKKYSLLSIILFITAFVEIKSSLIRTDEGHILQSVIPSIIILIYIIYQRFKFNRLFLAISIGIITLNLFSNIQTLTPNNFLKLYDLTRENTNFFDLYKIYPQFYTKSNLDKITLTINSSKSILIYPYDNFLLNINRKTFNTYSLQFYDWSGSKVEEKTVEKIALNPPNKIIYMIDKKGVIPLDNIPNISRNPYINKWIINNYSVESNNKSYLVLKFDKKGAKYINSDCKLYDLEIKDNLLLFENLIKPSSYYLENDEYLRLPVSTKRNIFVFENFSNASEMEKLINSNISKAEEKGKDKKIIKKFSVSVKKEVENSVNCY